ncbi:uncharacterized protein LOC118753464, partial [Rhagoletis pomonella]|uniref:uncharacterized protein LOC118753464 n=1 Tax=Rhagoletis pomonella TaxID=28610 RepID=UPI00178024EF
MCISSKSGKLKQPPVVSANTGGNVTPRRLFIFDRSSGTRYLVDTGADISVTPPTRKTNLTPTQLLLQASNGTRIETYGEKAVVLNVGLRQPIRRVFCVASVPYPIIGADLIHKWGLVVDLRRGCIIDPNTGAYSKGFYATAPITSITALNEAGKFTEALKEFPELLGNPSNRKAMKHSVKHIIPTTGPPCVKRVRQLCPERLKVTKEEFKLMVEL